ncbi:hypothetical protein [Streptomyces sp. NPDC088254]|uniref:hypothetical protein n=1 Tax=Streptomyces sp. NPDC088254 TaxID=3365847 RepID=UPI00382894A5
MVTKPVDDRQCRLVVRRTEDRQDVVQEQGFEAVRSVGERLLAVYKRLGIRPRLAVVPPTLALAPIPLAAAQTNAGWWAAALTGGAWASLLAPAAWSRYRILTLSAAAALLLSSLVVLYR